MKINIWQFLMFSFASIWVLGDVFGLDYQAKMGSAVCVVVVLGYLNDVVGEFKRLFKK